MSQTQEDSQQNVPSSNTVPLPDRLVDSCWRVRVGRDDCRIKIKRGDVPENFEVWFQNPKGEWRHGDTLIWHAHTRTLDSPDRCISFWFRSAHRVADADCIFAYLRKTTAATPLMPFERTLLTALAPAEHNGEVRGNQHVAWGAEEEGGAG